MFEVAEFSFTEDGEIVETPDNKSFKDHIQEMLTTSVSFIFKKHQYKCTYSRDKEFISSWLELLVRLKKMSIDILDLRRLMDNLTWFPKADKICHNAAGGMLEFKKFEGTLTRNGTVHAFSPFLRWVCLLSAAPCDRLKHQAGCRQILVS